VEVNAAKISQEFGADIIAATEPKFTMDRDAVAKVAQQCNM
jgi:hypothetical protein